MELRKTKNRQVEEGQIQAFRLRLISTSVASGNLAASTREMWKVAKTGNLDAIGLRGRLYLFSHLYDAGKHRKLIGLRYIAAAARKEHIPSLLDVARLARFGFCLAPDALPLGG